MKRYSATERNELRTHVVTGAPSEQGAEGEKTDPDPRAVWLLRRGASPPERLGQGHRASPSDLRCPDRSRWTAQSPSGPFRPHCVPTQLAGPEAPLSWFVHTWPRAVLGGPAQARELDRGDAM